jgi:AcrR family transcriptional regulator
MDEALDRALEVFWARGYEGATLPELTKAMVINRPSLYAAFGNKEQLFRKALNRYQTGPMSFENGDLPKGTNCATLGRYVATVLGGLAVQAASGTPEKELGLVAAMAMRAWPS